MAVETIKATEMSDRVAQALMGKTEERLAKGVFKLPDGIYVRREIYTNSWGTSQGIRITIGFHHYRGCERSMRLKYLPDFQEKTVKFDSAKLLKKVGEVEIMVVARKESLAVQQVYSEKMFQKAKELLPGLSVTQDSLEEADVKMSRSRFDYGGQGLTVSGDVRDDPCSLRVQMQVEVPPSELEGFIKKLQSMCDKGKEEES